MKILNQSFLALLISGTIVGSVWAQCPNVLSSMSLSQKAQAVSCQLSYKYPSTSSVLDSQVLAQLQKQPFHTCGECHTDDGSPGIEIAVHGQGVCIKCG